MKKIKHILLVDDSDATNFFNKMMLNKSTCVTDITIAKNGEEALKKLTSGVLPEFILLDINMPVMNGWEFLDAFHHLRLAPSPIIFLMIGTPLLEVDKQYTQEFPYVQQFEGKMLTQEFINHMVTLHNVMESV